MSVSPQRAVCVEQAVFSWGTVFLRPCSVDFIKAYQMTLLWLCLNPSLLCDLGLIQQVHRTLSDKPPQDASRSVCCSNTQTLSQHESFYTHAHTHTPLTNKPPVQWHIWPSSVVTYKTAIRMFVSVWLTGSRFTKHCSDFIVPMVSPAKGAVKTSVSYFYVWFIGFNLVMVSLSASI